MLWLILSLAALGGGAYWLAREGEFTTRRLPSEPPVRTGAMPRIILFLGDSLTASGYWQRVKLDNATVVGKGWKGKTIAYVMAQAKSLIESVTPTEVVFLAGVNNIQAGQSIDRIKDELKQAWKQIHDAGARVWAVKLTPWFGYKLFNDATEGKAARDKTLALNLFIDAMKGTPDGPDYVIDTAELGDEKGRLRKRYSWDGLHMIGKGYAKLGDIVQMALGQTGTLEVQVGDAIFPALQEVIDELKAKLKQSGVPPLDEVEFDGRTVTFVYEKGDVVAESVVKAGELLPRYRNVLDRNIEKRVFFTTRTEGRGERPVDPESTVADVGAEVPADVQWVIDTFTDRLKRNDIPPADVRYEQDPRTRYRTVTFLFHTGFRKQRADEVLPSGTKYGAQYVYIRNAVIAPEAEVGVARVPAVAVPAWLTGRAGEVVDRLTAHDVAPVRVTYDDVTSTLTLWFYTDFRARRAREVVGLTELALRHRVAVAVALLPEAEVGADPACGPYGVCCPTCGAPKVMSCKCALSDSKCANGHWWHYSKTDVEPYPGKPPSERTVHSGQANHGHGPCCINPTILNAPTQGVAARIGQVIGTSQETPWTCGPAALRSVLAHYGMRVEEGWLANQIGNVPVLGVRPTALVEGAQRLGCTATLSHFVDVNALKPFLAHDVPVIVIVDSFLHPGKQGHYVVVTAVGADTITLMDPHVEGNRRILSHADFEARWWNKEPGPDGKPHIAKHLAVVVVAGEGQERLEVGGEKPTHGRTAKIKGASKGLKAFAKVSQAIAKAVVTFFTGPAGAKAYDALLDATGSNVAKMKPNEQAAWFNTVSNPEMYVWALAEARDKIRSITVADADPKSKDHKKALGYKAVVNALGLAPTSIDDLRTAMVPALKMHLWYFVMRQGKSKFGWLGQPHNDEEWNAHALQSILILFYGGLTDTWLVVKTAVKHRPKLDWNDSKSAEAVAGWVDAVVAALEPYRKVAEGADNPLVDLAGEQPPPTHGRTAKMKQPGGLAGFLVKHGEAAIRGVTKTLVTAFSGGTAGKFYDSAMDELMQTTAKMSAREFAEWINNATSEEVYAWAVAKSKQMADFVWAHKTGKSKRPYALLQKMGIAPEDFVGEREAAGEATFRMMSQFIGTTISSIPAQAALHALQAIAILDFGGVGALPLLDARLKAMKKGEAFFDWLNVTMSVLKAFEDAERGKLEGAPTAAGGWRAESQRNGVTARQMAVLEKARTSLDPQDVMRAHFLARSLGLEQLARALGQRHIQLAARQAQALPAVVGKKKGGETGVHIEMPDSSWMFDVEYLKQTWPLVEAKRADAATLDKAMKIAESLDRNTTFRQQADKGDVKFVTDVLAHLQQEWAPAYATEG